MAWIPNFKEIESVLLLQAPKRYEYLIKKIVDQEVIWSLWKEDGWALAADSSMREAVPIWPHEDFARTCATGIWDSYQPKAIPLEAWLNLWVPGIQKDKRLVAVFPTPKDKGIFLEASRMAADLQQEMQHYDD